VTERLYRDDPYLLEFDAVVVARRRHEDRPAVVLDRTAFYAESGGQPWDTGTLGGTRVVAVVEDDGAVVHVLDGELPADRVHGLVDAERRRDHREQHHGQHLFSRALVEVASARTLSFHLGAEDVTIDLDRFVSDEELRRAETRTNEVVWRALPVSVREVTRPEAETLLGSSVGRLHGGPAADDRAQKRSAHALEQAGDRIRIVEVEGFDLQACSGTHPRTTAEVGVVLVLGHERYKGGSRIRFVCGHRALAAMRRRQKVLDEVGAAFSSGLDELPEAARRTLGQLRDADKRGRDLLDRAMEGEARRLLSLARNESALAVELGGLSGPPRPPTVVVRTYEGWPAGDLRVLAGHLVALAPCVALLGSRADKAHLVFAQSDGLPHDVPALLRDALALVGGRGGGRGNVAQGGGDRVEGLDEALAQAERAVRARA
jgi:alanyl-tRNA synthetase